MSSWGFAPRFTRLIFTGVNAANAVQVASGESIRVWGFIVSNPANINNNSITIESADGTTTLYSMEILGRGKIVMDTPFIADAGLRAFITDGGSGTEAEALEIEVTFFHSHPGS